MEWRDLEVWRRQRSYVGAELRKDAPDHLARLGLATSLVFVVGMAEGARVSALKGDLKFPIRYAIYNAIPSFVGGKVPASSVASAMASAPPLRACPRAAAHAANLRALRTAVAGYTVLSIVFQVALAGGRGTQAYQQAVEQGSEVPSMPASELSGNNGSAGGVVRLCGVRGLEPALVAATAVRGGYRTPILPVVISGGTADETGRFNSSSVAGGIAASFLPEGALAAVLKRSPRPSYYRIDRNRLFCREAWQPVAAEVAEAATGAGSSEGGEIVLVVEADSLSSAAPQSLMSSPVRPAAVAAACGGSGGTGDGLSEDQAVWGLAMLRRLVEEKRERDSGRVASVLLAERRFVDVDGASTVSIDARAALLLSVLSWAQQCAADALAHDLQQKNATGSAQSRGEGGEGGDARAAGTPEEAIVSASTMPEGDGADSATTERIVEAKVPGNDNDNTAANVGGTSRASGAGEEGEDTSEAEQASPVGGKPQAAQASTIAKVLGVLENMGRGVRVAVAPFGQLQSVVGRSLGSILAWVEKNRRKTALAGAAAAARSRVLIYDTDDDESFRWLAAQMLKTGWVVKRASPEGLPEADADSEGGAPVLVHHRCGDERTLTAAAGRLGRSPNGPPVCAVVHSWDCGIEARRLLVGTRAGAGAGAGAGAATGRGAGRSAAAPVEVICTAEVGEDLFQFVRWQLLSGATPEQVQKGLDDLFGGFYDTD